MTQDSTEQQAPATTSAAGDRLSFEGRVAVITGAGRGIGREYALAFADRGASVVVNDLGGDVNGAGASEVPARQVVEEITALGGSAVGSTTSVATAGGGEAIVRTALDEFGRIDIVVNNAGIADIQPFSTAHPNDFEQVLGVHFFGTLHVLQAAWPHLVHSSFGRIVNTVSAAGFFGFTGTASYASAKGAIFGLTRSLAVEGAPHNITVNCIAPAGATRMAAFPDMPDDLRSAIELAMPPARNAPLALYLAHEECDLTGEVLSCRGARYGRIFVAETRGVEADDTATPELVKNRVEEMLAEPGYRTFAGLDEYLGSMLAEATTPPAGG